LRQLFEHAHKGLERLRCLEASRILSGMMGYRLASRDISWTARALRSFRRMIAMNSICSLSGRQAHRCGFAATPGEQVDRLVLRQALSAVILVCCVACEPEAARCEKGLCPVGRVCNATTGLCETDAKIGTGSAGVFGRFTLLKLAGGETGAVAYDARHKSLALLQAQNGGWRPTFIAGPAAAAEETAAGQACAAVVAPDGKVHVAWLRQSDATLWYGVGSAGGWHREQVLVAAPGSVSRQMAIGLWLGSPTIAYRDTDIRGIRVARREANGEWKTETVPAPLPRPGRNARQPDLGRSLAMAIMPAGPAITAYDAVDGDLVLAVRSADDWSVARIAGSDPITGADTGDCGDPSALALGPAGDLVVAYRNRSSGEVLVARSKAGVISHQVVAGAAWNDKATASQRVGLLGTALAVALLPNGRALVAMQDGSHLDIRLASETPTGTFAPIQGGGSGGPHAWPSLLARSDGVVVASVALHAALGPAGGSLVQWTIPKGATP